MLWLSIFATISEVLPEASAFICPYPSDVAWRRGLGVKPLLKDIETLLRLKIKKNIEWCKLLQIFPSPEKKTS